ncbi:DUF6193 family natural product biosynthesis protein [Streptomyces sp. NPDC085932]|uniref:DUF6193 family natural product biosynthesis protein n=1 Tax=Streptomyces sp. NPDC085932 TaxID=3365741 RepID=UPI0037D21CEE
MAHPPGPPPATGAWRTLLARAEEAAARHASPLAEAFAELVRVAHTEPLLRRLHPWAGMWELHFSRCTEHPPTWDVPYIGTSADGRYRVEGPSRSSPRITETGCARVAVARVVERLPPGCGPAFEGGAHELAAHERARDGSVERA